MITVTISIILNILPQNDLAQNGRFCQKSQPSNGCFLLAKLEYVLLSIKFQVHHLPPLSYLLNLVDIHPKQSILFMNDLHVSFGYVFSVFPPVLSAQNYFHPRVALKNTQLNLPHFYLKSCSSIQFMSTIILHLYFY